MDLGVVLPTVFILWSQQHSTLHTRVRHICYVSLSDQGLFKLDKLF